MTHIGGTLVQPLYNRIGHDATVTGEVYEVLVTNPLDAPPASRMEVRIKYDRRQQGMFKLAATHFGAFWSLVDANSTWDGVCIH